MKSYVGMTQCYFCNKNKDILFDKRLKDSLPMQVGVIDMEPCQECKDFMDKGIILISVKDDTTPEDMGKGGNIPNPHRTGGWCVVKDKIVDNIFENNLELKKFILNNRFGFITDQAWDMLGLPRNDIDTEK